MSLRCCACLVSSVRFLYIHVFSLTAPDCFGLCVTALAVPLLRSHSTDITNGIFILCNSVYPPHRFIILSHFISHFISLYSHTSIFPLAAAEELDEEIIAEILNCLW